MVVSPVDAGLLEGFPALSDCGPLESISMLGRAPVLGLGLPAGDVEDCESRFVVFDLTMARARRSCSRSFLRAFEELREIAGSRVSQVQ